MQELTGVEIANLATFLFLAFWAALALRAVLRGERYAITFVILVHFIFCGVPLLLDILVGQPEYLRPRRLYFATRDQTTSFIYCAYVAACCPIWWWTGRSRVSRYNTSGEPARIDPPSPWFRHVLRLFAVSPALFLLIVPDPLGHLSYFSGIQEAIGADAVGVESIPVRLLRASTFWSILACAALFVLYRKVNGLTLLFTPLMVALSIWIQGKRSVVAIAVTIFGFVLWERGYLRGGRLVAAAISASVLFAGFSYWHLSTFRNFDLLGRGADAYYERARVDFGRDDVIKLAIFNELGDESARTLDYRGQSSLFYLTVFVPRTLWPDKPWPYAVYVTASALEGPKEYIGSGFTTSVLDEALANTGFLGFLIGPLILSLVCRMGDSCGESWILLLTVMIAVLLSSLHLAAFGPLMLLWVLAIVWVKRRRWHRRVAMRPLQTAR